MLLTPRHGFVFLAMGKTGTTAIEAAFRPHSQVILRGDPSFRHTEYAHFQRFLQSFLATKGFQRHSYEVVCAFREPIDWLASWWRYRSREELTDPSHRRHHNYVGHLSFEQFVRAYMNDDGKLVARMRRPSEFVQPLPGQAAVDHIFRYDRLDLLVDFLCEKVGKGVQVSLKGVSPEREASLSEPCKREVREFFTPKYRIYEQASAG